MKKFIIFMTVLCATSAQATEWQVLGARAQGMGGAGVALPNGAESAYWNPAGLGVPDNKSGVQVPVGGHVALSGTVLEGARDLQNVASACQSGGPSCTNPNIQSALNELNNPDNGLRADGGAGLGLKFGRLAFFVNDFFFAAGKPKIDMADNTMATIANNNSALLLRGINATEFGAAYGHELPFVPGLYAGAALKGIVGKVGFDAFQIGTSGSFGGSSGNFTKNAQQSFEPSVDLGALWDMNKTPFLQNIWWRPRVGITAHDITSPSFKYSAAAQTQAAAVGVSLPNAYHLQGGVRAGAAISPLHFWNIVADLDLTRNLTALEGVQSQEAALGTEINIFNRSWLNIPLRGGVSRNLAEPGSKTALAAGFGLNFIHLNIDVGATVTPGTETVQSQGKSEKLNNEMGVGVQLALLFGGNSEEPTSRTAETHKSAW